MRSCLIQKSMRQLSLTSCFALATTTALIVLIVGIVIIQRYVVGHLPQFPLNFHQQVLLLQQVWFYQTQCTRTIILKQYQKIQNSFGNLVLRQILTNCQGDKQECIKSPKYKENLVIHPDIEERDKEEHSEEKTWKIKQNN